LLQFKPRTDARCFRNSTGVPAAEHRLPEDIGRSCYGAAPSSGLLIRIIPASPGIFFSSKLRIVNDGTTSKPHRLYLSTFDAREYMKQVRHADGQIPSA
jgi:hypothetical protein